MNWTTIYVAIGIEAVSLLFSFISYKKYGADKNDGWAKMSVIGGIIAGLVFFAGVFPSGSSSGDGVIVNGVPLGGSLSGFLILLASLGLGLFNVIIQLIIEHFSKKR